MQIVLVRCSLYRLSLGRIQERCAEGLGLGMEMYILALASAIDVMDLGGLSPRCHLEIFGAGTRIDDEDGPSSISAHLVACSA